LSGKISVFLQSDAAHVSDAVDVTHSSFLAQVAITGVRTADLRVLEASEEAEGAVGGLEEEEEVGAMGMEGVIMGWEEEEEEEVMVVEREVFLPEEGDKVRKGSYMFYACLY